MRDILKEIYEGIISEDEAWIIKDEVLDRFHSDSEGSDIIIPDEFGMDFRVLLDLKIDYFDSLFNDYKPLAKAYDMLEKITGGTYYDEAFELERLSEEIVYITFWLTRCSPPMSHIAIFDKKERFHLSICKYGNIHFTGLTANSVSEQALNEIGLKSIEEREYDNFGASGAVGGRKLNI
jgi:hypothetical protein